MLRGVRDIRYARKNMLLGKHLPPAPDLDGRGSAFNVQQRAAGVFQRITHVISNE